MNEGIDLGQLRVLHVLLEEGHVGRAAKRLRLSQPATSHALAKLRARIGDPLLVRRGTGVMRTPRAEALRPRVAAAIELAESALADDVFDPREARFTMEVATSDYGELLLLPYVMNVLARDAPGVRLVTRDIRADEVTGWLAGARIGLFLGRSNTIAAGAGITTRELFADDFVCLVAKTHPLARKRKLSLADFVGTRQALVTPGGSLDTPLDAVLAAHGKTRQVHLGLAHFMVMPYVVAETDLLVTLPRNVAAKVAQHLPVVVLEPPLDIGSFRIAAFWHERSQRHAPHVYVRQLFVDAAAQLPKHGRRPRAKALGFT